MSDSEANANLASNYPAKIRRGLVGWIFENTVVVLFGVKQHAELRVLLLAFPAIICLSERTAAELCVTALATVIFDYHKQKNAEPSNGVAQTTFQLLFKKN